MDATAIVQLRLEMKNLVETGFEEARQQVADGIKDINDKLDSFKQHSHEAGEEGGSSIMKMAEAFGVAELGTQLLEKGIEKVKEAFEEAKELSENWETDFARANSVLQTSKENLEEVSRQVEGIAAGQGRIKFEEVPNAFNELAKSGENAEEALKDLAPTLKAAGANFVDAGRAAQVATDLMDVTGVRDINKAYDILAATVKAGEISFDELSGSLSRLMPTAKELGFTVEGAAGALATLTGKGMAADAAAARLETTYRLLTNSATIAQFKKLGIDVYDSHTHQINSLESIIENFNRVTSGVTDQQRGKILDYLGLDSRSGGAFLNLAQSLDVLREKTKLIENSQGALNKQYEATTTKMDNWNLAGNQVKERMKEIGDFIIDIEGKIGDGIIAFEKWYEQSELLKDLWGGFKTLVSQLAGEINTVINAMKWGWEHSLGPIFKKIEQAYTYIKWFKEIADNMAMSDEDKRTQQRNEQKGLADRSENRWMAGIDRHINEVINVEHPTSQPIDSDYYIKNYGAEFQQDIDKTTGKFKDTFRGFTKEFWGNLTANEREHFIKNFGLTEEGRSQTDGGTGNSKIQNLLNNIEEDKTITGAAPNKVTINIGEVIHGDWVTHNPQFQNMTPAEFERWFGEMLARWQHNANTGYN